MDEQKFFEYWRAGTKLSTILEENRTLTAKDVSNTAKAVMGRYFAAMDRPGFITGKFYSSVP